MRDLQDEQRLWLVEQLEKRGRGARGALAAHLGIRNDAITRMTNLDGKKEAREISFAELVGMAEFFAADPPGLAGARTKAASSKFTREPLLGSLHERIQDLSVMHLAGHGVAEVSKIPLLDKVTAGKLKSPSSQIPVEDVPLLAFADLGRGDFFALTVDGDSMDRLSPDGSVIIVNQADRTLVAGRAYVISRRGEATFKLWRSDPPRFSPYSTNPVHEPVFVKSKEAAQGMVVGRVKRTVLDL